MTKKNRQRSGKETVIVHQNITNNKARKGKRNKKKRGGGIMHQGKLALVRSNPSVMVHQNPFSQYAEGARIIDGFRAMTVAYPIPTSDILSTDSTGAAQMLVLPNLSCSALILAGTISNTNGLFRFATSASVGGTDPTVSSGTPISVAGVSVDAGTNLRTVGTSYRLVGWGVVIRSLPGVSSTGRVIMTKFTARGAAPAALSDINLSTGDVAVSFQGNATAPTATRDTTMVPLTYSSLSEVASRPTVANFLRQNGLPPLGSLDTATTMAPEALRRIPGTVTASVASLGVNGLLVRGKRTSNQYLGWRGTGPWPVAIGASSGGGFRDQASSGSAGSESVFLTNAVLWNRPTDATYLDMTGHDGLALVISGAAASTAVLDYEVIYHVEVTPRTEALLTSLRPPVADNSNDLAVAEVARRLHAETPHFQLVPHHFREMANGVLAGLSGKVSQAAMRVVGATAGTVVGRAMTQGLEGAIYGLTL